MLYSEFVTSHVKWLSTPQLDLVHCAMGLLGECVEFTEAHLPSHKLEELGDIEFYYEHANQVVAGVERKFLTVNLDPVTITREESRIMERDAAYWITHHAAKFHDKAKKAFIYNKDLAELDFRSNLLRVNLCLYYLSNQRNLARSDVQGMNQEKLTKRYPMGYSDQAAQARVDKTGETDEHQ